MRINQLIIWALISGNSIAQSNLMRPQFQQPMEIPLSLSGNFMELRSDHFHSGLDMRTESREGIPVRAAGSGWVSRIKVSPWGYGHALYIDHPNGYTTVYGHLRNYTGAIAKAVRRAQYKAKSFEVDLTFGPSELPVEQGDIVAHSGNSGGSSGPHLHFEVRRTSDQHALDPEQYGMEVGDSIAPVFLGLRIDPLDTLARVQPYPGKARGHVLTGRNGAYTVKGEVTPKAWGTVGLSVNVIDRYNNSSSTCGIRSLKVTVDDVPVFSVLLDHADFSKQRYANAYMDYALFKGNDKNYNRCYKLPNNTLDLYGPEAAQGRITLIPGKSHQVLVEATDANGNRSVLPFTLVGATVEEASRWPGPSVEGRLFLYDQENSLTTPGFWFTLPANALYTNERIRWSSRPSTLPYAPIISLHDRLTPLHVPGQLNIKVDEASARGVEKSLVVVRLDEKGTPSPVGGTYTDGWISAKVKSFSDYTVMLDTVPPKVTALNLEKNMAGREDIRFQVTDNLSGIESYSATLDGDWILLEYDPKRKMLTHTFDEHTNVKGPHRLELVVKDERGNARTLKADYTR